MKFEKLNPWNWFKHEDAGNSNENLIPIKRPANTQEMPASSIDAISSPVLRLRQEMNRLIESMFYGGESPAQQSAFNGAIRPSLNIGSDKDSYDVSLEVPGVKQSDISIEVSADMLVIQGEKQEEKKKKDRHYYRVERSYGSFQRTLAIPEDANIEKIKARMDDGVLTITIPRQPVDSALVKTIPIGNN